MYGTHGLSTFGTMLVLKACLPHEQHPMALALWGPCKFYRLCATLRKPLRLFAASVCNAMCLTLHELIQLLACNLHVMCIMLNLQLYVSLYGTKFAIGN
jgi:hypothetical protein